MTITEVLEAYLREFTGLPCGRVQTAATMRSLEPLMPEPQSRRVNRQGH